jgi:hypothetical protein
MFKLIKLAVYVFLGYALYELYQGMSSEAQSGGGSGSSQNRGGRQRNRQGQFTGSSGRGKTEMTQEPAGTSQRHQVGRGVV